MLSLNEPIICGNDYPQTLTAVCGAFGKNRLGKYSMDKLKAIRDCNTIPGNVSKIPYRTHSLYLVDNDGK